jgi:hypothetical protein
MKKLIFAGIVALLPFASPAYAFDCDDDDPVSSCSDGAREMARDAYDSSEYRNLDRVKQYLNDCWNCASRNLDNNLSNFNNNYWRPTSRK